MNLIDQVAQANAALEIEDSSGQYSIPGAGQLGECVRACPTRFIADANVAALCRSLAATDRGMLDSRNSFLRLPSTSFWLEWHSEQIADGMSGRRTGLLVDADPHGRTGRATIVWEQDIGEPVIAQMSLVFDLDNAQLHETATSGMFALKAGAHPLASHLVFELQPTWQRHFSNLPENAAKGAARQVVANLMPAVDFLFVFSSLLAERTGLAQEVVDFTRLNRQRTRKSKAALLDHVKVRLDLRPGRHEGCKPLGHSRVAARLHPVRGHMVHRAGQIFWRRSHLRGDASRARCTRTVHVTQTIS